MIRKQKFFQTRLSWLIFVSVLFYLFKISQLEKLRKHSEDFKNDREKRWRLLRVGCEKMINVLNKKISIKSLIKHRNQQLQQC